MEIKVCNALCCKGSAEYNEDIIGFNEFGAWVLDGATGLNNKNLISDKSDANWYVNWWNNYLHKNIHKTIELKEILREGIKKIKKEYYLKVNKNCVEKLDIPSSSIAIVKFHDKQLEYFILGDCALHLNIENETKTIKDINLCYLDKLVYDRMESLTNLNKISFEEIKESVMDILISNRLKKNTIDGYWILDFEEEAINNSLIGILNIKDNIKLMLTSDGFSCISDRYNEIDENDLIKEVENKGANHIYNRVREIEKNDLSTTKFPRFKVSDDSSCIYLDISF